MARIYGLLAIVELALLVYCLIDCIQTDSSQVRNLPKVWWLLLVLFFPLVGGIAWLYAGRPPRGTAGLAPWRGGPLRSPGGPARSPGTRGMGGGPGADPPRGPDDDPDFLRHLGKRPPRSSPGDDAADDDPADDDPPAGRTTR
jgi:hypothetical protein